MSCTRTPPLKYEPKITVLDQKAGAGAILVQIMSAVAATAVRVILDPAEAARSLSARGSRRSARRGSTRAWASPLHRCARSPAETT